MKFLRGNQVESQHVNLRYWAWATLCPLIILFLAMAFKPLWRDEYWSLFFADPALSFSELLGGRLRDEVHPPFYYFLLHSWQKVTSGIFSYRLLSTLILIISAIILRALTPKANLRQLAIFLLICAGSYWVIYFSAEVRPYVLLFSLASISVFIVPKLIGDESVPIKIYILWALIGGVLGITHYFGALWFSCIGFVSGLAALLRGYKKRFFLIGVFTVIGLIPVISWLFISFADMDLSGEQMVRTFSGELMFVINQFLRGLLVKTFGSNPLVTYLGIGGLWIAFRNKNRVSSTLLWAVLLTIFIAFIIHFSFVALIKERAFSVIMPALLFIFATHITEHKSVSMRFLPLATLIMPLMFWGEYFKNREGIPELREVLLDYSKVCKGQPVLAYYGKTSMHEDFSPMASRKVVNFKKKGVIFDVELIDVSKVSEAVKTSCPVKGVGILLQRRNAAMIDDFKTVFTRAGLDLNSVEEMRFGKGRNIIWVEK